MDETDSRKSDLEIEGFSLFDFSSEDDCLLNSPNFDLLYKQFSEVQKEDRVLEFLGTMHDRSDETSVCSLEEREEVMKLHESPELGKAWNNEKYNLRKSLAWDNAFFTSAGVLDPEELSSIIEGNKKGEKHRLPGIQEDICRSVESVTTLGSDNLTIESLEADLFEDIRASIQKSSDSLINSNCKKEPGVTQSATTSSSNKPDLFRNKMKNKVSPKKPSVCIQGSGKTGKQGSVRPQVSQSVATRGGLTLSASKPPKLLGRVNSVSTTSTKRASLDVNRVKIEREMKSGMGRGALLSKKPALGSGRNILPKSSPSAKSSLRLSAAIKTDLRTSCSSLDSCSSASSSSVDKSSLASTKKKTDSRSSNPSSSGSAARTPSRSKSQPGNSHLSTSSMSKAKPSSCTSPSSSISELSSESSAISTFNQGASLDTISCKRDSVENSSPHILNHQNHVNSVFSIGDDARVSRLSGGSAKRVSTGTGQVIHPPSMRPSGLRMPSPKIGFFDAVRSLGGIPNGSMQPCSRGPGSLPKPGSGGLNPSGSSTSVRPGKLQSSRTLTSVKSTKLDTRQTTLNGKRGPSLSIQESSNFANRSASRNVKNISISSPKGQNGISPRTTGGKPLMPEEEKPKGGDKVINNPDLGFAEKGDAPGSKYDESPGRNLAPYVKDIKMISVNGGLENDGANGSIFNVQKTFSSRKGNTEKKVHFADEVDKLTRKFEAVVVEIIKTEIEKEITTDSPSLICKPKEQVLDSPIKSTLPHSPLACDSVTAKRMPLVVNNSSHDRDGMLDTLT